MSTNLAGPNKRSVKKNKYIILVVYINNNPKKFLQEIDREL